MRPHKTCHQAIYTFLCLKSHYVGNSLCISCRRQMLECPPRASYPLHTVLHTLHHLAMFQYLCRVICHLSIRQRKLHHLRVCKFPGHVLCRSSTSLHRCLHQRAPACPSHSLDHQTTGPHTCSHRATPVTHNHLFSHSATHPCKLLH